jgi:rhodanese-related sulfurtransferase
VAATANAPVTPVLLDVREPWEVQTACVSEDGFKLLTIPMRDIPARLAELDPDQPVACLCHHGMRSQQVANFLAQSGFTEVVNLQGGIDAWSREIDSSVPRY